MSDLGDMIAASLAREMLIAALVLFLVGAATSAAFIFGIPALWHFFEAHWR